MTPDQIAQVKTKVISLMAENNPNAESRAIGFGVWIVQECNKAGPIDQFLANTIYTELVQVIGDYGDISVELYKDVALTTHVKSNNGLMTVGSLSMVDDSKGEMMDSLEEDDRILIHPQNISRLESAVIKPATKREKFLHEFEIKFQILKDSRLEFQFINVPSTRCQQVAESLREIARRLDRAASGIQSEDNLE
jgi:hypothetical protein